MPNFLNVETRLREHSIGGMMRRIEGLFDRYFDRGLVHGGERVSREASPRSARRALVVWDGSLNEHMYREARRDGVSLHVVANRHGVSSANLYQWAKARGLPRTVPAILKAGRVKGKG